MLEAFTAFAPVRATAARCRACCGRPPWAGTAQIWKARRPLPLIAPHGLEKRSIYLPALTWMWRNLGVHALRRACMYALKLFEVFVAAGAGDSRRVLVHSSRVPRCQQEVVCIIPNFLRHSTSGIVFTLTQTRLVYVSDTSPKGCVLTSPTEHVAWIETTPDSTYPAPVSAR